MADETDPERTLFDDAEPSADDTKGSDALGDLQSIARSVFSTWAGAAEIAWAGHAWTALGNAGLTDRRTDLEHAVAVLRLLALSVLHQEFCARAFEEGYPADWSFETDDAVGDYPLVDAFFLGQLAERGGIDTDDEIGSTFDGYSARSYALRELVRAEYRSVVEALEAQWGAARLFASLWLSNSDEVAYPLTEEAVHEVVNYDLTPSKANAWQWIDDGLEID